MEKKTQDGMMVQSSADYGVTLLSSPTAHRIHTDECCSTADAIDDRELRNKKRKRLKE